MRTPTVAAPERKLEPPRHGASHAPPSDAFSLLLDTQITARTAPAEGPQKTEHASSPRAGRCAPDDAVAPDAVPSPAATALTDAAAAAASTAPAITAVSPATAEPAIVAPPASTSTPTTTLPVVATGATDPAAPTSTPTPANSNATQTGPPLPPAAIAEPAAATAELAASAVPAAPVPPAATDGAAPKPPRNATASTARGDLPSAATAADGAPSPAAPTPAAPAAATPAPAAGALPAPTTDQAPIAPIAIDAPAPVAPWTVAAPTATPTAAVTASTAIPVGPQLVDRIELMITNAGRNGHAQARIQLHPAELGSVSVILRHAADGLHATLTAHRADAVDALTQTADDLRRGLEERGVVLAQLNINVSADGRAQAGEQREAAQGRRRDPNSGASRVDLINLDDEPMTGPATVPAPGTLVDVIA